MTPRAAIIAGGKGTRIRSLCDETVPKALVPVAGEPIGFLQLRLLERYGIREVAIIAGHLAQELEAGLALEAERLGVRLEFYVEERPMANAGGLHAARSLLGDDDFLVFYGDIAVDMDLDRLVAFHRDRGALATIVVHPNDHPHESDLVAVTDDCRVTKILPRNRPRDSYCRNLVPASVFCLAPEIFDHLVPDKKQSFEKDVFPRLIESGERVCAYNTPEYLRDMGTVERHAMVEADIRDGLCARMNWANDRPTVFFDRDGVLTEALPDPGVINPDGLVLTPSAGEAVRVVNRAGWLAVLVTNQPQIAKGFTTVGGLEAIHAKFETLLGLQGAKIDRIFYCPHHPERGFDGEIPELKVPCSCRKPESGMLLSAAQELPVDMSRSCMIGDTCRDIGAARAAGIQAFGVRTGNACRDCIGEYRPDLIFSDALEAVRFAVSSAPL